MGLRLVDDDDIKPEDNAKSTKCCRNCRHFAAYSYDAEQEEIFTDMGECRRYPPFPDDEAGNVFTIVEETLWCGEFDF